MDQFARRTRLLRYACIAMVIAAGLRGAYAGIFEPARLTHTPHWALKWTLAYTLFIVAFAVMPANRLTRMTAQQAGLASLQALAGIALVWLYPSFIVTGLLVVVAWQFALLLELRLALTVTGLLLFALAVIPCPGETAATQVLVVASCAGFQLFAVCAAQLTRSEMVARDELARTNTELQATQAILADSTRLAERLRIARDLHDVMGHTLTILTIHLDVANRLTNGDAAEHLACARSAASELLEQVRSVVSRFRNIQPTNLHSVLEKLAENARGLLKVQLRMPDTLAIADPAHAETVIRCVQELITNAMRHARARELIIEVRNNSTGLIITAHDDGQGGQFAPGSGLVGMRERFELLGGKLSISSVAGKGFSIEGILPMAESMS